MVQKICCLMFLSLMSHIIVYAQNINEEVQKRIDLLQKSTFSAFLFVHTDKSIYTENEPIWFSAYLVNFSSLKISKHRTLHLFLFRDDNRSVALSGKFKMEEGISAGDLVLPDSIVSGKYHLVAYTDVLGEDGQPLALFSTPLTLKSTTVQTFSSKVYLADTSSINGPIKARVQIERKGIQSKKGPLVDFVIHKDTLRSFELKTKEADIEIPNHYLMRGNPVLQTIIRYNHQIQHLSTPLPRRSTKRVHIRFFPEGGELAAGIPSVVAVEAKSSDGESLALTGILLKGNIPIDTIETNSYGIGKFSIIPDRLSTYTLKVKAGGDLFVDSLYHLPSTTENSLVLHLNDAVANDTLRVKLLSNTQKELQVLLHNNTGFYTLFNVKASLKSELKLPLHTFPKGISTITVLDELGRPLAESLFFAHYDKRVVADISVNKSKYSVRDSVDCKVRLRDALGNPLSGLFSIAVVQSSRLESTYPYIDDYVYLIGGLDSSLRSFLSSGKGMKNKDFLEDMLLIKGWRKYTWQHLMQDQLRGPIQALAYPDITGQVKRFDKLLKEPVELVVLGSQDFSLIKTDQKGLFQLTTDQMRAKDGAKLLLMVSNAKAKGFTIEINDPSEEINKYIAEEIYINMANEVSAVTQSEDKLLKGLESTQLLQEVMIKGRRGNHTLYGYHGKPGVNDCGDYVDEQGFLNYEYSVNRYQPIEGKLYSKRTDLNANRSKFKVDPVYYNGCQTKGYGGGLQLEGIYGQREFYGVVPEQTEAQYLSTIFWNSRVTTDELGEASVKFHVGDIKDGYHVIVQGITDNDVFSGASTFRVE